MKKYVCWSVSMIACLLAILFLAVPGKALADYPDVTIPGFLPEFGQRSSYTIPEDINPNNVSVNLLVDGFRKDCGMDCIAMVEAYYKGYESEDDNVYHAVIAANNANRNINWAEITSDPNVYIGIGKASVPIEGYKRLDAIASKTVPFEMDDAIAEEIYNQISDGNPVLIHRPDAYVEHWVVIYGYEGSLSNKDPNKLYPGFFMTKSPHIPYNGKPAGVFIEHLSDLKTPVYDNIVYRTTGLSNLPESDKYQVSVGTTKYNSHYYRIYTSYATWDEAKRFCETRGGHLATITNQVEQNFIDSLNSTNSCLWVGGYREDDFDWHWITGEDWNYTNWSDGEPNNSDEIMANENRVALWPNQWNDINTNNTTQVVGFICEFDSYTEQETLSEENDATVTYIVASGSCGEDTTWTLDNHGLMTVTGIGDITECDCYSSDVLNIVIEENVTGISSYVFSNYVNLAGVTFPSSLISIGGYAFSGCGSLESLTIPFGLQNIGPSAFSNCTGLNSIVLPSGLQSIGANAFYCCSNVEHITCSPDTPPLGSDSNFSGSAGINAIIRVGSSVAGLRSRGTSQSTDVGQVFRNCKYLKSVVIDEGVTGIGEGAFTGCDALQSVTIASTVSSIADNAFHCCGGVKEIICFPGTPILGNALNFYGSDGIDAIVVGDPSEMVQTFKGLDELKSITIQEGVTGIGEYAFADCKGLQSISIPSTVLNIGERAFYNCDGMAEMIIPSTVTCLGDYAFAYCDGLTSIVVPSSITEFGEYVFSGCAALSNVQLQEGLTSIGSGAFSSCNGLTSIVIPSSVTTMGFGAFGYCHNLKSVSFSPAPPATGVLDAFYGCDDITVIIRGEPKGIKRAAFQECTWITGLEIQEGVTEIGAYAFSGCTGINTVVIPASTEKIYSHAFSTLDEISLSSNVPWFGEGTINGGENGLHVTIRGDGHEIPSSAFSNLRSIITGVTIEDNVTGIGENAFSGCSGITSVEIPSSVTTIGAGAFSGCSGLETLNLSTGLNAIETYAFHDCTSLSEVTIPTTVENIGNMAFYGCSGMIDLTIQSAASIGDHAFYQCTSLSNVVLDSEIDSIGTGAFRDCVSLAQIEIPSKVKAIENATFNNCKSLISVSIPDDVESIGTSAFSGCSSLTEITLPSGLTSIGYGAFMECGKLTDISIPSKVQTIDGQAFWRCGSLRNVSFMEGLQSIGNSAFYDCTSIASIAIPSTVSEIGAATFQGCTGLTNLTLQEGITKIGDYAFAHCNGLTQVILPSSLNDLGKGVFYDCNGITTISIPIGITTVSESLFENCGNLSLIYLPEQLTSIDTSAFSMCSSLGTINIPSGVTEINDRAFYHCSSLTAIDFPEGLLAIGNYAFEGCEEISDLVLPDGLNSIGEGSFYGCKGLRTVEIPSDVANLGNGIFDGCDCLSHVYFAVTNDRLIELGNPLYGSWTLHILSEVQFVLTNGPAMPTVFTWTNETMNWPDIPFDSRYVVTNWYTSPNLEEDSKWDFDDDLVVQTNMVLFAEWEERTIPVMSAPFQLPASTKTIEDNAFEGSPVTIVYIPEGCELIGAYAFKNCVNLQQVMISGYCSIGENAFNGCQNVFIIAPKGSPAEDYCEKHANCQFVARQ